MKKKILFIIILFIFMFIPYNKVEAKTLQDLYDELASLKAKKNAADEGKKLSESELAKLNSDIATITKNIINTQNEIKDAENEVKKSEEEISNKKEETNDYLLFLQLSSSGNTYLEYLFDADDYTDFIYRYAVVSQMSEYNNNLINDLEKLIKELDEKKVNLSDKQKKLEQQRKEYSEKANTVRANITKQTEAGSSLADDIKGIENDIKKYEANGCRRNQSITECETIVSSRGWQFPLRSGWTTSEYSPSSGHWGIDLAQSQGTPVYPAAPGKVAKIIDHYWCGGNMVYINHYVNGKYYTTAYMHLLEYYVYAGQEVNNNTVIGIVGGYTTSAMPKKDCPITFAGKGGYDYCTCGAHLHFAMADGISHNNFNPNSFNPRNIFNFGYSFRR